jgi:hypothetical protein
VLKCRVDNDQGGIRIGDGVQEFLYRMASTCEHASD